MNLFSQGTFIGNPQTKQSQTVLIPRQTIEGKLPKPD